MHAVSMLVLLPVKGSSVTNLQIRGIPSRLRDKIRTRAARKRQTMSQYLIDLIQRDTEQPSMEEFLEKVARWTPIPTRMGGARAVREARRLEEGLKP